NTIRCTQCGDLAPLGPLDVAHAGAWRPLDTLRSDDPAQGPPFRADLFLEQDKSLEQGVRTRRAARHVDIDWQKGIDPLDDAVDVVHAAGIRARPHRNDPARLQHLVVEPLYDRRHLDENRPGNDDEIGLSWAGAQHLCAETRDVVFAGEGRGHFHVAARKTEIEGPDRILLSPGYDVL